MAEVTNDDANDLADEILSRDEFLPEEPGRVQEAVGRVFEEIGDFLAGLFGALGGVGGSAGMVIAILLLIGAVALLGFAIYRAIKGRRPKERSERDTTARIVFDEVVEPAELKALLDRFMSESDWRNAVIAGFRLSVVQIIDRGIAREVAGATTGYFAAAVGERRPEILEDYLPASEAFERAFYSDLAVGREDLAHVERLLNRLELVGAK